MYTTYEKFALLVAAVFGLVCVYMAIRSYRKVVSSLDPRGAIRDYYTH